MTNACHISVRSSSYSNRVKYFKQHFASVENSSHFEFSGNGTQRNSGSAIIWLIWSRKKISHFFPFCVIIVKKHFSFPLFECVMCIWTIPEQFPFNHDKNNCLISARSCFPGIWGSIIIPYHYYYYDFVMGSKKYNLLFCMHICT